MNIRMLFVTLTFVGSLFGGSQIAADVVESFSGTGGFTSTVGGQSGFENSGWFNLGTPGVFQTNASGEQVYTLSIDPDGQNSLNRFSGGSAFSSTVEISNPSVLDSLSGIRFGIVDSASETVLIVLQNPLSLPFQ